MKPSLSVLAVTVVFSSMALATGPDTSRDYVATVDPPTGTIRCGFNLSGTVKSPASGYISYGFFFRSELNIVTALNRNEPLKVNYFSGPGSVRATASSKDFLADDVMLKHKSIQVQLRFWRTLQIVGKVEGGGPQFPALAESAWVDVPVSSQPCATTRPLTGLTAPASSAPVTVKH